MHFDDVGARATEVLGPGLRDRKVDCVLQRIALPLPEGHLTDDINAEVLFDDELVIAAGSNTRWARRRNIDLAELIDEPWILPPPGTWYHAFVSKLFQARGLEVPKAEFGDPFHCASNTPADRGELHHHLCKLCRATQCRPLRFNDPAS